MTGVIHLAAQAGVRYSLKNPYAYVHANVLGQVAIFETVRRLDPLPALVYASSSSVYGGNDKFPFSVADRVDRPVSLYAATKRSGELLAESYAAKYGLASTGLRFFTVYGPWGRPDMAYYSFTAAILAGEPDPEFSTRASWSGISPISTTPSPAFSRRWISPPTPRVVTVCITWATTSPNR